jgi:hypothetical protein
MATFERERTMPVGASALFGLVQDVAAMDAWLPDGLQVESDGPERVVGHVYMGNEVRDGEGYFTVDAEERRLEWGDLEGRGYGGWLQVNERGPGKSTAVLHLDVVGDHPEAVGGGTHEITDEYLDQALDRLAAVVTDRA